MWLFTVADDMPLIILHISYGAKGTLIINETLLSMFVPCGQYPSLPLNSPPKVASPPIAISIDVTSIAPLTVQEFFSAVLIPWTAVLLIQADHGGTINEAVDAWHNSFSWGSLHSLTDPDSVQLSHVRPCRAISPTHIKEAESKPGPLKTPASAITPQSSWHTVVELDASGNTVEYIVCT